MTRRARLLLAAAIVVIAGAWTAAGLSRLEIDSDLDSLLPADDPTVQAMDAMAAEFGGDPIVVLVEGGGDPLGQERLPQLLRMEGELSELPHVVAAYGPATTLNQTVLRVKQMLADLSGQRDALKQAGLTRQLRIFDERYGSLMVRAMPAGLPTLRNPAFVRSVVTDPDTGATRARWRQYLPAPHTVAVYLRPEAGIGEGEAADLTAAVRRVVESSPAVPEGARVTVTGAPVVSVGLAHRLNSEVPRLALSAFAVSGIALLVVPWSRRRRWRLTPLLAMGAATLGTLACFGWRHDSLSIGAATFLPIILGLGSYYPVYLAQPGRRRVVLAVSASSALAFAGLLLSPLPFVKELGFAVPLGLAQVVAFSLLASWARGPGAAEAELPPAAGPVRSVPRVVLVAVAVAVVIGSALGWTALSSATLKTDPQQLLAGLPALDDAVHVEDVLGYSGEIDVRLVGDDTLSPAALAWSRSAEESVVTQMGDRVHPVVTVSDLLSFLGDHPTEEQVSAGVAALPPYVTRAVVSADGGQALTSYGVAWSDVAANRDIVRDLQDALPPAPAGYHVEVSGLPVAAERGYDLVSSGRYEPSLIALAAAAAALVLLLPRRRDAFLAILSATVATGLTIATLVVLVGALNPLTMALGALTAAVGSEFTVLLLASRREDDAGLRRSVLLAVLLSLGGYGVLLTSSLPVLRELGVALTASVLLSVLTAVVLTNLQLRRDPSGGRAAPADQAADGPDRSPTTADTDRLQTIGG